ncbi:MAG TPA: endonuclease [Rhodobacteraceae bacterium]|nr:endonuclease [Paracoccaceae bacterium]
MRRLAAAISLAFLASAGWAETIRVASFDTELSRDGPGLLLRDIERGQDAQIAAVIEVIARVAPDILALQGIDWDHDGQALSALAHRLAERGAAYPHRFATRPNAGIETGLDLDGDGRTGGPGDAQGYGRFTGDGGMAVLSRFPMGEVRDFSALLWRDLPGAALPVWPDGAPFPSAEAQAVQRLAEQGFWIVPVDLPEGGRLSLLTFRAAPPVFDGPEDRNGLRNHDEILFWRHYLDGAFGPAPEGRFVIAGNANLDPFDGEGRHEAIRALLNDQRVQDPAPRSPGATTAADQGHQGPNALDTADWPRAGRLRVDYVLPSADWQVAGAGVYWPEPGAPGYEAAQTASRHRLVWVDLILP